MPAESMSKDDRTSQPDSTSPAPALRRIVLKLSGESFQGSQGFGIDAETVHNIAREVKEVYDLGVHMAIIVGGGNIFRGTRQKSLSIDRATGDYMGMLSTVINGLALQDALEKQGVLTRLLKRDRNASGGRTVHSAARHAPPRKRPRRHFCRGHRQSLFLDRHGSRAARHGNQGACHSEGHARRWNL